MDWRGTRQARALQSDFPPATPPPSSPTHHHHHPHSHLNASATGNPTHCSSPRTPTSPQLTEAMWGFFFHSRMQKYKVYYILVMYFTFHVSLTKLELGSLGAIFTSADVLKSNSNTSDFRLCGLFTSVCIPLFLFLYRRCVLKNMRPTGKTKMGKNTIIWKAPEPLRREKVTLVMLSCHRLVINSITA